MIFFLRHSQSLSGICNSAVDGRVSYRLMIVIIIIVIIIVVVKSDGDKEEGSDSLLHTVPRNRK